MNYHLACDVLETIELLPTSPELWQRLCSKVGALDPDEKSRLVDAIASRLLAGNSANWLRYGALAFLTRDPLWFVKQSSVADADTPADAIMALLGLCAYQALARTLATRAFVQLFIDIDAPRLQRLVAQRMQSATAIHLASRNGLRVAVYTPQIVDILHGGTGFTLNIMNVAAQLGAPCQVFTAQEATISEADGHYGGLECVQRREVFTESLVLNVPGNVQMLLPNVEFSLRFRLEQMLAAIHSYEPDVVIFVGFMSPLVYRLFESYPIVGLSLHALPPIAPVDVWLSADPLGETALWPGVPAPKLAHYPFRFWPKGQAVPIDRAKLQIPATAVVLITTGYRLDTEMSEPWRGQMLDFIEAHQNVHWLLIGIPEGQPVSDLPARSRIHCFAPQVPLESWLAACDIYINPPRVGGGGTVGMAMEQGLAVLTMDGCDGGDKVGVWATATLDSYFERLATWSANATERQQVGAALKGQFHTRLDISSTQAQDGLLQACQSAIESFKQRTGHRYA